VQLEQLAHKVFRVFKVSRVTLETLDLLVQQEQLALLEQLALRVFRA
jgi:hypothetical protein